MYSISEAYEMLSTQAPSPVKISFLVPCGNEEHELLPSTKDQPRGQVMSQSVNRITSISEAYSLLSGGASSASGGGISNLVDWESASDQRQGVDTGPSTGDFAVPIVPSSTIIPFVMDEPPPFNERITRIPGNPFHPLTITVPRAPTRQIPIISTAPQSRRTWEPDHTSDFTCGICLNVREADVNTTFDPCRHGNFCRACVEEWVEKYRYDICPICRQEAYAYEEIQKVRTGITPRRVAVEYETFVVPETPEEHEARIQRHLHDIRRFNRIARLVANDYKNPACYNCRGDDDKYLFSKCCTKRVPSCSKCLELGLTCEYPSRSDYRRSVCRLSDRQRPSQ